MLKTKWYLLNHFGELFSTLQLLIVMEVEI